MVISPVGLPPIKIVDTAFLSDHIRFERFLADLPQHPRFISLFGSEENIYGKTLDLSTLNTEKMHPTVIFMDCCPSMV
jgi:hypothetical protein